MSDSNAIERLWRRIHLMFASARTTVGKDDGPAQTHQVKINDREIIDNLIRVSEFGLASNLPEGTDVVVAFIRGDRSQGVILGSNHQTLRLKNLGAGEVALYDAFGKSIWLKENEIVIEAAGKAVTINNATDITLGGTGDMAVTVGGNATVDATGDLTVTAGGTTTVNSGDVIVNATLLRVNGNIEATGFIHDHV